MAQYYKIKEETMAAIADRTRAMANTPEKLTPAEIVYWLGRVKFIVQGHASSACNVSGLFESGAVGSISE